MNLLFFILFNDIISDIINAFVLLCKYFLQKGGVTLLFCSFSSKLAMEGYTVIDNTFLNEFLPQATGDDIKIYLYSLTQLD